MSRKISIIGDLIDISRSKRTPATPDKYDDVTKAQNDGVKCPYCGSVSGHYATCAFINKATREAAAFVSNQITEEDRILAHGLGVIL